MGSNTFGNVFRITTWGESHGQAMGVVIDGCPAGLAVSVEEIQLELDRRRPGRSIHTSPRREKDQAEVLSGLFEGKTTGAPIAILIANTDADSTKYEPIKEMLRPGHANYTYLSKYGIFDDRGGGRASARETVCRVAAGSVAKKLCSHFGITMKATLKEVGGIENPQQVDIERLIESVKQEGDSVGGIVEVVAEGVPVGLGDPIYEKLEGNLAKAVMTLPATKGVEFGAGFAAARMKGSQHNDLFTKTAEGDVITQTNHAGGMLGGISTGMPLVMRVAFKPTSSIKKKQETLDIHHEKREFCLPEGSRHDPCVALRAPPIVEAVVALVLADALLMNRVSKL